MRPTRQTLPHYVLVVLIVAQGAFLLYICRNVYFAWGDDYDFFLLRGTIPGVNVGLWAPHDDHWMTAVVLIDRLLFSVVGLQSYLPYVAVTIGFHLALVAVIYELMIRVGSGRWTALAAAVVGLFAGIGAQAVLWNTAVGLVGALTLGWVAVSLLERRPDTFAGRLPAVLVLVVGLTFSGTGVVAVCFAAVHTLQQHGWRSALKVLAGPAAVFILWYVAFGHVGVKEPLANHWDYLGVVRYVWLGLTSALEGVTGIEGSGAVLFLGVVAIVLGAPARVPPRLRALALSGLCGAIGQLSLAALSRPSFGEADFQGGRYAYLTVMFLVPSVAVALTALLPLVTASRVIAVPLAVFALVAVAVNGSSLFHQESVFREGATGGWPGLMKGIRAAAQNQEQVLTDAPPFDYVHVRFRADLAARKEMWDALPRGDASPDERLDAENFFFTGVDKDAFAVGSGAQVRPVLGFESTRPLSAGCRTITATAAVASLAIYTGSDGAQFGVSGPSTKVVTHLVRDEHVSGDRTWDVTPGRGIWIATSAPDAELVVNLGAAGDYDVCKL